ncbi:uncharacterized protein LOC117952313 isoform X6 [Etheostoma cragini]|uniref:uncharacterized protein LOC117952313 isoform X6 n=1 Tax=Etheostoma cragini TaxID=417921 RepID=UPI00155EF90F|nr:uncharacterized protein LOC117952313 isoform X6 [Etheostoma cragini]
MEAVVGLLLMLLGVSHGVETYCDGRQDGAQCYGALGGTVVLQLMDNASEIFRYTWSIKPTNKTTKTNTTTILHGRKNVTVSNLIANRSIFTPSNGTFRINNLNWTDGGEYELLTFDSDGKESEQRTLQLTIQAGNRYLPTLAGVLSAMLILLVVCVAVVCAQKKKPNSKPKEEENLELTYADVRTVRQPGRQMQQRAEKEGEVEYGQLKFSERPQQTVEPAGDECVYPKVRKDT